MSGVLSIVFFNMILTAVYLPGYRYATNIDFNYSRELATQGFTNIFTCIPSYFLPSYSITIHKIGETRKIYGIISSVALIFNTIFGLVLKGYVPTFLLCMIPFLLGFTFFFLSEFKRSISLRIYFIGHYMFLVILHKSILLWYIIWNSDISHYLFLLLCLC